MFSVPATYSLDLSLNSDGNTVSGLQLELIYTTGNGSGTATYGTTPVTALGTPFTTSDISLAPAPGDPINSSEDTAFFKQSAGDYPAVNGAIAAYQFNTSGLGPGTYVFSPVGVEFTNSTGEVPFASPQNFTLTIVPEPSAAANFAIPPPAEVPGQSTAAADRKRSL